MALKFLAGKPVQLVEWTFDLFCLAFKINKKSIFVGKHFAHNIAFRTRKVSGTFEKRTPEPMIRFILPDRGQ